MDTNNKLSTSNALAGRAASAPASAFEPVPAALELNVEDYRAEVTEMNLTDAQAAELLQTLWSIMRGFVDLGFDVGTLDLCGQIFDNFNTAAAPKTGQVKSMPSHNTEMPSHGTE